MSSPRNRVVSHVGSPEGRRRRWRRRAGVVWRVDHISWRHTCLRRGMHRRQNLQHPPVRQHRQCELHSVPVSALPEHRRPGLLPQRRSRGHSLRVFTALNVHSSFRLATSAGSSRFFNAGKDTCKVYPAKGVDFNHTSPARSPAARSRRRRRSTSTSTATNLRSPAAIGSTPSTSNARRSARQPSASNCRISRPVALHRRR